MYDDPITFLTMYNDIISPNSIIMENTNDKQTSSFILLESKISNNDPEQEYKRIPVIKSSGITRRFIWFSKSMSDRYKDKTKIYKKINNSKIILTKKGSNLLLVDSRYFDTYCITCTIPVSKLNRSYINGIKFSFKMNRLIILADNSVRICQGYFMLSKDKAISVNLLSISHRCAPVVLHIDKTIFIIHNDTIRKIDEGLASEIIRKIRLEQKNSNIYYPYGNS